MTKKLFLIALVLSGILIMNPAHAQTADKPFIFGLLLVGPYNDHGWSQAHYDAGLYVEKKVPGTKMIYIDAFGEVSPCVFAPMSFGNVRERPLAEIWSEMRERFAPGSSCFVIDNHRLLRKRVDGRLPLPPEASREMMKDVRFGAPGRFVGLLGKKARRTA